MELVASSFLDDLFGSTAKVNSIHHQRIEQVGEGLQVVAWSPNGLPEAIQSESNASVVGVQWHPEAFIANDPRQGAIFQNFIEQSSLYRTIVDERTYDEKTKWSIIPILIRLQQMQMFDYEPF